MNLEVAGPLLAIAISILAFVASQLRSARADTVEFLKERMTACERERDQGKLEIREMKGMMSIVQEQNIVLLKKLAER